MNASKNQNLSGFTESAEHAGDRPGWIPRSLTLPAEAAILKKRRNRALEGTPQVDIPGESRLLTAEEQDAGKFVSVILADTEDVWNMLFAMVRLRRLPGCPPFCYAGRSLMDSR